VNTVIENALGWLATYFVHSTLLLLGALAVTWRLRDPAARERAWKVALVAPLLTASVGRLMPLEARPVLDIGPRWQADARDATAALAAPPRVPGVARQGVAPEAADDAPAAGADTGPGQAAAGAPAGPAGATRRAFTSRDMGVAVLALWVAGAGFLLLRRALALRRLRARLANRRELREGAAHTLLAELCGDDELTTRPRLTLVDELSTPLVLGFGEICLPRRVAEDLPERELAAILAHEVAHVRRGDLLWLRGCGLLEAILFVQPLNRLARRRLFEAAEMLCDDWAGERTGARLELAHGLATVARWSRVPPRALPLPCLGGDRGPLLRRVERLLSEPVARRRTFAVTSLLAAAVLALACVGPAVSLASSDGVPDVDRLSLDELIVATRQVNARASESLLALPADWQQRYAGPLAVPGTKAVRLLQRGLHELPPKRGGGAYYSFATEDHDYNREPDLEYQLDMLSTSFYGGTTGHVLDLGEIPLGAVTADAAPPGLSAEVAQQYLVMASFVAPTSDASDAFRKELATQSSGSARAVAGHSYLLRAILPDEHDHLVAFAVMEVTPESVVLVGRVLRRWPIATPRSQRPRVEWDRTDAPEWLAKLDDAEVLAQQQRLRQRLEALLLHLPETAEAPRWRDGVPDAGRARLLQRGRYDGMTTIRGDGAYFSFATRSNSYDDEPDIEWQNEHFRTGFYGHNTGAFVDLGDVPLASVRLAHAPDVLTPDERDTWDRLQARELPAGLEALDSASIVVGHTYLLRSVLEDEHDLLTAFRPVQRDAYGMTLEWRVLQRYPE
jgi:beta-lactamase regulating signal transducer with metallopeptidase domain